MTIYHIYVYTKGLLGQVALNHSDNYKHFDYLQRKFDYHMNSCIDLLCRVLTLWPFAK